HPSETTVSVRSMFTQTPPTAAPISSRGLARALREIADRGCQARALATRLTNYLGSHDTFLADSGRTALFVLFRELRQTVARRDPRRLHVVLPAYCCPAVAQVIVQAGLTLRVVDVEPETMDYDYAQLERAVDARTLAVFLI